METKKFLDGEGLVTLWKEIASLQSDYNETDETSPNYIKNKPFTFKDAEDEILIGPINFTTKSSANSALPTRQFVEIFPNLNIGDIISVKLTYPINKDGETEYITTNFKNLKVIDLAHSDSSFSTSPAILIGPKAFASLAGPAVNDLAICEDILFIYSNATMSNGYQTPLLMTALIDPTTGGYIIEEISCSATLFNPCHPTMISNYEEAFQSDYSQNDIHTCDHIKNRTHYKEQISGINLEFPIPSNFLTHIEDTTICSIGWALLGQKINLERGKQYTYQIWIETNDENILDSEQEVTALKMTDIYPDLIEYDDVMVLLDSSNDVIAVSGAIASDISDQSTWQITDDTMYVGYIPTIENIQIKSIILDCPNTIVKYNKIDINYLPTQELKRQIKPDKMSYFVAEDNLNFNIPQPTINESQLNEQFKDYRKGYYYKATYDLANECYQFYNGDSNTLIPQTFYNLVNHDGGIVPGNDLYYFKIEENGSWKIACSGPMNPPGIQSVTKSISKNNNKIEFYVNNIGIAHGTAAGNDPFGFVLFSNTINNSDIIYGGCNISWIDLNGKINTQNQTNLQSLFENTQFSTDIYTSTFKTFIKGSIEVTDHTIYITGTVARAPIQIAQEQHNYTTEPSYGQISGIIEFNPENSSLSFFDQPLNVTILSRGMPGSKLTLIEKGV